MSVHCTLFKMKDQLSVFNIRSVSGKALQVAMGGEPNRNMIFFFGRKGEKLDA